VKIPYEYVKLLEEEYGKKSMTVTTYERFLLPGILHMNVLLTLADINLMRPACYGNL
jgi:hypothetical protein